MGRMTVNNDKATGEMSLGEFESVIGKQGVQMLASVDRKFLNEVALRNQNCIQASPSQPGE